ncbi:MAG: hypothetical protein P1U57_01370 [Oleibacter sp.]|nr:hypothetical protein [Thalassolituus sp.]
MKILLAIVLCMSFVSTNAGKLITNSYRIETGLCPDNQISCKDIDVTLIDRITGDTAKYVGETVHAPCNLDVSKCLFRGYLFYTEDKQFIIHVDGILEVNSKTGQGILVEKGNWLY